MIPLLAIGVDAAGARTADRRWSTDRGDGDRIGRGGRDVSRARAQPQRRAAASNIWSTRPTSRWRCGRSSGSTRKSARAGRASGWRCTTGSAGSRSARRASRSPPPRRIAADAFAACRYAIERVKQIAPIWKREFFEGGDVWIEGATADPDDAAARAEAERVACA